MTADSDGPQPSGCISVRTTFVSKSLSVFEDKWRPGKAHASENIDAPRLRALMQPEGCGPSVFQTRTTEDPPLRRAPHALRFLLLFLLGLRLVGLFLRGLIGLLGFFLLSLFLF